MKKTFILLALITVMIPTVSFAEERDDRPEFRREEMRQNIDERRQEFQERREDFKTFLETRRQDFKEFRGVLRDEFKEKVDNLLSRIYEFLDKAIEKMETLADRLETKIDEYISDGKEVGDSEDLLAEARLKINDAKIALEDAKETLTYAVENEISKGDIRAIVVEVKDAVKSAHTALKEVVRELKSHAGNSENTDSE